MLKDLGTGVTAAMNDVAITCISAAFNEATVSLSLDVELMPVILDVPRPRGQMLLVFWCYYMLLYRVHLCLFLVYY